MFAKKVEELTIYVIALELAKEIHTTIDNIPRQWKIGDSYQIKRSSSSVPSNISEGFGQRFYARKFIHYLNIAKGSSDETQNHLRSLSNNHYIERETFESLLKKNINLSVRILNLINYLKRTHGIILD